MSSPPLALRPTELDRDNEPKVEAPKLGLSVNPDSVSKDVPMEKPPLKFNPFWIVSGVLQLFLPTTLATTTILLLF